MQIVLQDQVGHCPAEIPPRRVVAPQGQPQTTVIIRLVVDGQQQVEAVEQEMAAPRGRIQNPQLTRITFHAFTFHALTFDEIPALLRQPRLSAPHLPPQPAQGVVRQECHHVARRVELVAKGQLVAVARRAGEPASLFAQFSRSEELVDPPDGLILGPGRFQGRIVEQSQHLLQARLRRKEDRGGQGSVEERAQRLAQVIGE